MRKMWIVSVMLLAAACCRIPKGQSGAYSTVACGAVVTAELPWPAMCFHIESKRNSTCKLRVEITCEGEREPWTKELAPGETACFCCDDGEPAIRKIVIRCLDDDPNGSCTYCAKTLDKCP